MMKTNRWIVIGLGLAALIMGAFYAMGMRPMGSTMTASFDQQFIDAMIPHHQSAIDAAKAAETRAQRPEIKRLAQDVIAAQQREIDQMRQWRASWYASASAVR